MKKPICTTASARAFLIGDEKCGLGCLVICRKKFVRIPEIIREAGVPGPYIAKIFQALVRNGILDVDI